MGEKKRERERERERKEEIIDREKKQKGKLREWWGER